MGSKPLQPGLTPGEERAGFRISNGRDEDEIPWGGGKPREGSATRERVHSLIVRKLQGAGITARREPSGSGRISAGREICRALKAQERNRSLLLYRKSDEGFPFGVTLRSLVKRQGSTRPERAEAERKEKPLKSMNPAGGTGRVAG